ncbi:MAG: hypothetical protein ABSE43_14455 [Steroidobacteraceae bacterium]|jgi:hypothetical protein
MTTRSALILLLAATAATSALADVPPLVAGASWTVEQTTTFKGLTIPDGAQVVAAAGHSLTMTVDGVETAIAPGTYPGNVVLTPTVEVLVKSASVAPHPFRAALYVDDGKVVDAKSVRAALVGGMVGDTSADHVSISSQGEDFNGIIVTGNSHYLINAPQISLTGNGGDDTDGFGDGILSNGHADVTVNDARIFTKGAIRAALFIAGDSTMHVNRAHIEVFPGTLPADYQFNIGDGRVMMEVPWMLGLSGNVRATNVTEHGTVYYSHSHIKAHGWGALSTDGVQRVRMYVDHSLIETEGAGYGAYALGDAIDSFSHSTFNVDDYGLIIGGNGTGIFTDETRVNSHRFGIMLHQGGGGGITINKGSSFHTGSTLIEIKGRGTTIVVDHAKLRADNGILLQTMDNDDPFMKAMMAKGGMAPGAGLDPNAAPAKPKNDVAAAFSNVELDGDLIHAMTDLGELTVTLGQRAMVHGAITTATTEPISGQDPTRETYLQIGQVRNTFGPAAGAHGLTVVLKSGSEWAVRTTSYLGTLKLSPGAALRAIRGNGIALIVNGVQTPIKPGTYTGQIVLKVLPAAPPAA